MKGARKGAKPPRTRLRSSHSEPFVSQTRHMAALNLIDAASLTITNRPKGRSFLAFSAAS